MIELLINFMQGFSKSRTTLH